MVEYKINEIQDTLRINITNFHDNKEKILSNFNQCKEGKCSCPTKEYEKVKDFKIENNNKEITIILDPIDNANFDKKEIEKCLEYSLETET